MFVRILLSERLIVPLFGFKTVFECNSFCYGELLKVMFEKVGGEVPLIILSNFLKETELLIENLK